MKNNKKLSLFFLLFILIPQFSWAGDEYSQSNIDPLNLGGIYSYVENFSWNGHKGETRYFEIKVFYDKSIQLKMCDKDILLREYICSANQYNHAKVPFELKFGGSGFFLEDISLIGQTFPPKIKIKTFTDSGLVELFGRKERRSDELIVYKFHATKAPEYN